MISNNSLVIDGVGGGGGGGRYFFTVGSQNLFQAAGEKILFSIAYQT